MQNLLKYLSLIGKIFGVLGGLNAIPGLGNGKWLLLFAVSSILKDAVNRLGDYLDDGKANGSWTASGGGPGTTTTLLAVATAVLLTGCTINNPKFYSETRSTNGTVEIRRLSIPTVALWPATTDLAKQKAGLSAKSFSLGTEGLREETGSTNVVEALRSIDSILSRIKP